MTLQDCASQRSASDQMHIFLSTKSIFWQHFTMETLTANTAAKPVSWTSFYHPWSSITQRHSLQQDVPFIAAWPCNTALPNGTLTIRCTFSYLAALHIGNADGKHCSNACVTELRFITSEVAVPNGTAFIAAGCSLHISMTLQHSASQWNTSDQMHIFLSTKSIFWQHFTMETLMANAAAMPVSLNFDLPPLK